MTEYTNLLVVIDPDQAHQPALLRAIDIGRKSTAPVKMTLFLAIYDLSYDITSMLSFEERQNMQNEMVRQRQEWLSDLVEHLNVKDLQIGLQVVWHNRPYEAMVAQIYEGQHDILIKATHDHATLGSVIFTPTDWHLLRKSPVPVLLVKEQGWPENGRILTAVNLSSDNEVHEALNDKLINESKKMSQFLNAEVNLVNAYPATPVNVTIELPEFDPATYTDAVRGHHLLAMKALRQKHHIDEEHTFCEEGVPENIIPEVAAELKAGLVILGTTGRVGLSAIFIGNTAEHTIDQLNCDVLAIKPDGYISPLDPAVKQ